MGIENVHSVCHLSTNFVIFVSSFRYRECCLLYVFVCIGTFRFHVLLLLLVYLATLQLAMDSVVVGLNTCSFFSCLEKIPLGCAKDDNSALQTKLCRLAF